MDEEARESIAFYDQVEDQIVSVGVVPVGLSLPALVIALMLGNYPADRWRSLIADARLLFGRYGARRACRDAQRAQGLTHA